MHGSQGTDYITHELYWRRRGFQDPYDKQQQLEFRKCDAQCADDAHASPSYCDLDLFHAPQKALLHSGGYVSADGHSFSCTNPSQGPAFHFIVSSKT
jgi:hypothetical protein